MSSFQRKRNPTREIPSGRGTLLEHLGAAEAFSRLAEQARRLQLLQKLLEAALPAYLLPGTHVANFKQGKIIIHADSGAVAVKLRQLAPRLAEGFIHQGYEVTAIDVRVQARRPTPSASRPRSAKTLGEKSKQSLTSLSAGLGDDSPLKHALDKLLRNR